MINTDRMTAAYIEAAYFTETGDDEQPPATATLSDYERWRCWQACRNFAEATQDLAIAPGVTEEQLGHDLWLTRNHHGTGFWDRPELYGSERAALFTRLAHAMGEHDIEFTEEDHDQKNNHLQRL